MIKYSYSAKNIQPEQIEGFCVDWQDRLSPKIHLKLLQNSDEIVLAIDEETGKVVGFITAITDKIISAYIPLLEVLPDYQGKGIGSKLMHLMLDRLQQFYMIDLLCDSQLRSFYEKLGMQAVTGMCIRNHKAIQTIKFQHLDESL
ncbi:MAG: GNAT family N-acetyltransferase [Xenococcaceae cyanobacterium MO_188.B29]|nr:GNAT family N-acetyltransferase [Xenococcaceae cyanobacterium MO_188.B29]